MTLEADGDRSEGAGTIAAMMTKQAISAAATAMITGDADEQATGYDFEPDDPEEEVKYAGAPMAIPGATTVMTEDSMDIALFGLGTEALETGRVAAAGNARSEVGENMVGASSMELDCRMSTSEAGSAVANAAEAMTATETAVLAATGSDYRRLAGNGMAVARMRRQHGKELKSPF